MRLLVDLNVNSQQTMTHLTTAVIFCSLLLAGHCQLVVSIVRGGYCYGDTPLIYIFVGVSTYSIRFGYVIILQQMT